MASTASTFVTGEEEKQRGAFPDPDAIPNKSGIDVPKGSSETGAPGPSGTGAPGPSGTGAPGPSGTGAPGPSGTGAPGPSGTGAPGPSGTGAPGPSETGAPGPSETGAPGPSGTGAPGPSGTGAPGPSGTGAPGPSGTGALDHTYAAPYFPNTQHRSGDLNTQEMIKRDRNTHRRTYGRTLSYLFEALHDKLPTIAGTRATKEEILETAAELTYERRTVNDTYDPQGGDADPQGGDAYDPQESDADDPKESDANDPQGDGDEAKKIKREDKRYYDAKLKYRFNVLRLRLPAVARNSKASYKAVLEAAIIYYS